MISTSFRPRAYCAALFVCTLAATTSAQFDMHAIMQQQGAGMRMEDDNDPFVANEFIGSFQMEVHTYEGTSEKSGSPTNLRYWSSPDHVLLQMALTGEPGRDVKMLTDLKGKWQYMLMTDAQGKRMALKSKKKKIVVTDTPGKENKKEEGMDITTTNETKIIEGHTCTKMIGKCEEGLWTGWVAKDLQGPFGDLAKHVRTGDAGLNKRMSAVKGFALELEWVPADGTKRTACFIKDLIPGTVDADVFSTDGYEMIAIPSQ